MPTRTSADGARRFTHPVVFGIIELPFGAAVGFLQIAVPYWLAKQGVPLAQIAELSAVAFLPHAWKIFWMPLLDAGARRRTWFFVATAFTALLLWIVATLPDPIHHLGLYTALITLAQVGAATSSASVDALMALTTRPEDKGRAGGFKMAGNVGGIGVLGTLPIWLSSHMTTTEAGLIVAGVVIATGAAGFLVAAEPADATRAVRAMHGAFRDAMDRLAAIARDLWTTVKSREGWTGLVLCAAPVGAGALVNLYSAMAGDYHASEEVVELVSGIFGGAVGAAGAILGGYLADRMNRRLAYCLSAGITALASFAMAAAPMTPTTFTVGTLAYRFANGITMAAFAGVILEMVAHGPAVATKYTLFVALSNQAISYVTYLDGQASKFRDLGARGTILFDGILTIFGIAIVAVMVLVLRRMSVRRGAPATPMTT